MARQIPSKKKLHDLFWRQLVRDYDYDLAKATLGSMRESLTSWRDHRISSRTMLEELDRYLKGHGIEHLESENGRAEAYYVNMGDTYNPTIILDTKRDRVWATDWGSWMEAEERKGNRFS
jgi:hypothetical protein